MATFKNKDSKKIKSLINKLKTLATRGVGGEKQNAKKLLDDLMKKYNINKFEESKYKKRTFKLKDFNDCKDIMLHCILDTNPEADVQGYLKGKEVMVKLTDEEYVDVCEKFNHYYPEYIKQKELLLKAFILKNEIGILEEDKEELSDDEIDNLADVFDSVKENKFIKKNELKEFNPFKDKLLIINQSNPLLNSKEYVYNIVNSYPKTHKEGFLDFEIKDLLKKFPDIDVNIFENTLTGITCIVKDNKLVIYDVDIINGIMCGLEKRDLRPYEWD